MKAAQPPAGARNPARPRDVSRADRSIKTAIVLAGGLGTRLRSAVPDLPKPMAPVAGRPFLAHLLDQWIAQGIEHFVLSVGYRYEAIVEHFGSAYRGASLAYAVEDTPMGTGGGVLLAARQLPADAPFLVVNGDTWFDVQLPALSDFAARADADWCFALFRTRERGRYMGLDVAPDGRIRNLQFGLGHAERLANGGVYVVHPRSLAGWLGEAALPVPPLSLENELFPQLLTSGHRFFGLACEGAFIDIGVPEDFRRADQVLPTAQTRLDDLVLAR